jgi:hypothetical protein
MGGAVRGGAGRGLEQFVQSQFSTPHFGAVVVAIRSQAPCEVFGAGAIVGAPLRALPGPKSDMGVVLESDRATNGFMISRTSESL